MTREDKQPDLDRLIHERGRLAIMTILASVGSADFVFLQRTTSLTKGNLSTHLTRLDEAGLVRIDKSFVGKKPNTRVTITSLGKKRLAAHWAELERMQTWAQRAATMRVVTA